MKIRFNYDEEPIEVNKIYITIDDVEYRLVEVKGAYKEDGNLELNKSSLSSSSAISITPRVSNEIFIK